MMKNIKKKRELKEQGIGEEEAKPIRTTDDAADPFDVDKQQSVFNKSMEEETKTISNIA